MHQYRNPTSITKMGKVSIGLTIVSTFALADVAEDLGISTTQIDPKSFEAAQRQLTFHESTKCLPGQERDDFEMCQWTEESETCRSVGGLHWIEKFQRCRCPENKHWNDDIEQCQEFCTKGTVWDLEKQLCQESYKSKECRETKNGQYFMESTNSCLCKDGLFWDCFEEICVDLDISLSKIRQAKKEEANNLVSRTWYIQRKIEKEMLLRKWRLMERTRIDREAQFAAWTKAGCTQGQEQANGVCKWSPMSKICRAEWRDGLYFLGEGAGCACKPGKVWNKGQVACTVDPAKLNDKCGVGRAFDKKKGKCRWTKNSRICQRHGALYHDADSTLFEGTQLDLCACPTGYNWNGKECKGYDGFQKPVCLVGSFFNGLTQSCQLSENSRYCQKNGGLYYDQDEKKCVCQTENPIWHGFKQEKVCLPIGQYSCSSRGYEKYSYTYGQCLKTRNNAYCDGMRAGFYDPAKETCNCYLKGEFDLEQRTGKRRCIMRIGPGDYYQLEKLRLDILNDRKKEEKRQQEERTTYAENMFNIVQSYAEEKRKNNRESVENDLIGEDTEGPDNGDEETIVEEVEEANENEEEEEDEEDEEEEEATEPASPIGGIVENIVEEVEEANEDEEEEEEEEDEENNENL